MIRILVLGGKARQRCKLKRVLRTEGCTFVRSAKVAMACIVLGRQWKVLAGGVEKKMPALWIYRITNKAKGEAYSISQFLTEVLPRIKTVATFNRWLRG